MQDFSDPLTFRIFRMRYMSHFRAIHRGAFFTEMRTTEVRALLPDAWGFVCPVHTPDGSPCGLLNHLAMPVQIVTHLINVSQVPQILVQLGVVPVEVGFSLQYIWKYCCVKMQTLFLFYLSVYMFVEMS